ncbi:type I restriction-modification enzyme R subunit C-terminal domain-containing protein [Acidovorax sp.]|uniref:type I restriction-modification enzyme R subunit C-terminal domain-containing protein n=1 Tax=Acidovorax sp. TaxID=1872122 RepID=UPI0025BBBDD0|nr:type I restriction-modification enzyme R subunit C-terminal domain-containing protein [Acidovorax sp.]MBL7087760.1 restriction endonuclease subunit S [Acidovorax sp.]
MTSTKNIRIGDFCETGSGSTPSRDQMARYYDGGTIPWVKSGELRESIITSTDEHITKAALKETSVKLVPANALLVAMYGATVGRLGILGMPATTNQAVCHIVPDPSKADVKYLFRALETKVGEMLPTAVRDDDEDAKRFDALLLNTQLALLRSEPALARLQTKVQQLANSLLELSNVPSVREHLLLIEAVAGDEWWQDVTLPMLEQARRKLRSLIKLIEKSSRKVVYTDFEDAIGETAEVDLPLVASAVDFDRFRAKAKVFLRAHEDRLALHKLRRNQPLTAADLQELEALLHEAGGTDGDIERARTLHASLPVFVRSLVGLDREAAMAAFANLIAAGTASASQLQFVEEIVQHLTEHGAMPAARLYESPFTDIHAQGPDGVFDGSKVEQLFRALQGLELQQAAA